MKKWTLFGILVVIVLLISGYSLNKKTEINPQNSAKYVPTLFIHGWGSSRNAEKQMVNYLVDKGYSKTIMQATVDKDGKVSLNGHFKNNDYHPIVEVQFEDNKNTNYHTDAKWAKNVVLALQNKYHFKKMNLVSHSMGNMAVAYYLLDNAKDKKLPVVQKYAALAGHFDGVLGYGDEPHKIKLDNQQKPSPMNAEYRELMGLRDDYHNQKIDILNIYGDKDDGTNSDGSVTVNSARSLKYLTANSAKSYQEVQINGKDGQHSQLHESKQVDKYLLDFLNKG